MQWNEDIAYNSGSFTVTLGDIAYDNIGERYRLDDNQEMFWSLYDGYVGNFNRVILWLDPIGMVAVPLLSILTTTGNH